MELGMYSVELTRPTIKGLFEAIRGYGFTNVQFDYQSVLDEEMPLNIDSKLNAKILREARANDVKIVSVNGTFNMIHPVLEERKSGIRRFEELARHMHELECTLVTLCTGSRNPHNMWEWDDANNTQGAWDDLLITMQSILSIAEKYNLLLGLETEPNNCMNTVERCKQIMDVFKSPRLKVIMDIANLFQPMQAKVENVRPIMRHAFNLIGKDVVLAHGKDILAGDSLHCTSAGSGIVDFPYFKELLDEVGYDGCMLLHGIKHEEEFSKSVSFIQRVMA